jgi:hypothetical protein
MHIDVWDLRTPKDSKDLTKPQTINRPFAQAVLDQKEAKGLIIDINCTGTEIIVGGPKIDGIPFSRLSVTPTAPADKDLSQPWRIGQADTIIDGNYYELVSFYRKDFTTEEGEKCFTSNGCTFSVYDIRGSWTHIYSIPFQSEINFDTFMVPYSSIQGGYFAWVTDLDVVTIWDFETGDLVSHIFVGTDQQVGEPCLSPDGSIIAIPVKNTIQIRDSKTGIKLGVFKKNLSNDSNFEVVLGQEYFMTYNTTKSTSKKMGVHNARDIVSLRNLSSVQTIRLHQDYHVEYPQNCDNSIFAYEHVSKRREKESNAGLIYDMTS